MDSQDSKEKEKNDDKSEMSLKNDFKFDIESNSQKSKLSDPTQKISLRFQTSPISPIKIPSN